MKRLSAAVALLLFAISAPANATIIGGSVTGGSAQTAGGTFVKLTVPLSNPFGTPNSVGADTFESPNLYGFDEDQNILLTTTLIPDVGSTIAAGTTVASHYIFFDPGSNQNILGTVDFDSDVLAIMTYTDTLAATDFLANTGVTYLNPGARGLEPGDNTTISGLRQISFNVVASSPGDYIRVLTAFSPAAATPEPSDNIALLGGGLAIALLAARRGRKTHG